MRASVGSCPLLAPVFVRLILRVLGLGRALPAVFCPWSCVSLPLVLGSFLWCFCCAGVSACAFAGVFSLPLCASLCVMGFLCVCPLLGCCRLPSPACCCFPPPCGWSLVASWPSFFAGPSLWVSGCFCDGLVALPYCLGCGGALSSSLHFVSWQQRPLALCGVCFTLYTMVHVLLGCSVLLR